MTLISLEDALAFPFANGQYDTENADEHFISGCRSYHEYLEDLPVMQSGWIPCKERLPEMHPAPELLRKWIKQTSDACIITIRRPGQASEYYTDHDIAYLWDGKWNTQLIRTLEAAEVKYEVIAWMPLPKPYRG